MCVAPSIFPNPVGGGTGADFDKRLNVLKPKLDGGTGATHGTVVSGEGIVVGPPPPPGA